MFAKVKEGNHQGSIKSENRNKDEKPMKQFSSRLVIARGALLSTENLAATEPVSEMLICVSTNSITHRYWSNSSRLRRCSSIFCRTIWYVSGCSGCVCVGCWVLTKYRSLVASRRVIGSLLHVKVTVSFGCYWWCWCWCCLQPSQ